MKSILAIIALGACATASRLGFATETVPAMPFDTAKWDLETFVHTGKPGSTQMSIQSTTIWKKGDKSKVVTVISDESPSKNTEELMITPVMSLKLT